MSKKKLFANPLMSTLRRLALLGNLAIGSALLFTGCQGAEPQESTDAREQPGGGFIPNGGGFIPNGGGFIPNGGGFIPNGGGFIPNGGGFIPNGGGQSGLGWNGVVGLGQQYKAIGWNNATHSWTGPAWGGVSATPVDCAATGQPVGTISTNTDNACTTLHNVFNHADLDGDGISGEDIEKAGRLAALSHWVACTCPAGTSIPFSDTHGWLSEETTFQGVLGLSPKWCGSDTNQTVTEEEQQIVSACMLALQNTKWKHFYLSLRSYETNTAPTVNEDFLGLNLAARYFGNLWKDGHVDYDHTTCNAANPSDPGYPAPPASDPTCSDPSIKGGAWYNKERFSVQGLGVGVNMTLNDQWVFGRECEVSDCNGGVSWLGGSFSSLNSKKLAGPHDPAKYAHDAGRDTFYEPLPDGDGSPGGLTYQTGPANGGGTQTVSATYRGKTYRTMDVYTPFTIPVEDPFQNTTYNGGIYPNLWTLGLGWTQMEPGTTVPTIQSTDCPGGKLECQGNRKPDYTSYSRRLLGLTSSQTLTINQTGYNPQNASFRTGDGTTPVVLALRYKRSGCLGDHQCNVDLGCAGTAASECASGQKYSDGSCKGNSGGTCSIWNNTDPGKMEVWVMNKVAGSAGWAYVHGNNSAYDKNIFPVTGEGYNTAYIYPVYLQNSYNTIQGVPYTKPAGNTSADTLRVRLKGSTADYTDSPQIDTAYFSAGMPTPDMDCTGGAGCWLYAGPNQAVSLTQGNTAFINGGTPGWMITPTLPPGTYTFRLKNVLGDLDLHVKANGLVSDTSYDCRPYQGRNQEELCTMKLDKPGYFSVMVKGFANQVCSASAPYGCDCAGNVSGCAAKGTVVGTN